MKVRADRAAEPAAFEAALAVVAEARDDAPERLGTRIEPRPARMILEACDRPRPARVELGLEEDVADHATVARHGLERQEADARHLFAVEPAIAAPEQLIAAAHREHRRAAVEDCLPQRRRLRRKVLCHEELLAVLAAADVVEVVCAGDDRVGESERRHVELVTAPRSAAGSTAMLPRSA